MERTRNRGKFIKSPPQAWSRVDKDTLSLAITIKGSVLIALVSDSDLSKVSSVRWHINHGYAVGKSGGKICRMHRLILGTPSHGMEIDHINGNRLDNRRENLRFVTRSQNNMNRKHASGLTSIYKGVSLFVGQKTTKQWVAQIQQHRNTKKIGYFMTELEAAKAYDRVAMETFGEYARPNFPKAILDEKINKALGKE